MKFQSHISWLLRLGSPRPKFEMPSKNRREEKIIEIEEKVFSSFFFSLLFLYRYYNYRFMDFSYFVAIALFM